jgi:hypothetical protein
MFGILKKNKEESIEFDFFAYIESLGYKRIDERFYRKRFKQIKLTKKADTMIGMNMNRNVKHNHVITCKVPQTKVEADIVFELTHLKN